MTSVSPASHEPDSLRDARSSDPAAHGWMEGFPPPPDRAIVAADGSAWAFPRTRWAFSHMRELYPTANVSRGEAPVALLPRAERHDLDAVVFTTADGRRMTWGESLAANYTDGVIVLHRGVTVQERYFGALQPELAHTAMSVTESFVGTLAAMLADRRVLDPQAHTGSLPCLRRPACGFSWGEMSCRAGPSSQRLKCQRSRIGPYKPFSRAQRLSLAQARTRTQCAALVMPVSIALEPRAH